MNVLITGGSGFIGLHTVKVLLDEGFNVVVYDLAIPPLDEIKELYDIDVNRVRIVRGDVVDVIRLLETMKRYNIKYVVHMATLLTRESEENPHRAFKVNVESTVNLLELARITDISRIVYISSEAVYGVTEEKPLEEDYPKKPISMYGITKLASELIALKYSEIYGLDVAVLRFPMVYGPGLYTGGARLINYMVEEAVNKGIVRIEYSGESKVEPLYVKDAAYAISLAIKVKELKSKVYNIGIGRMYTLKEIFEVIREFVPNAQAFFGNKPLTFIYPAQGPFKMDRSKLELGYSPRYSLKAGIEEYIKALKTRKYY